VDHEAVFLDYITMYKHTYICLALRIVSLTYLFLYYFSYHLKNLYTGFSTVWWWLCLTIYFSWEVRDASYHVQQFCCYTSVLTWIAFEYWLHTANFCICVLTVMWLQKPVWRYKVELQAKLFLIWPCFSCAILCIVVCHENNYELSHYCGTDCTCIYVTYSQVWTIGAGGKMVQIQNQRRFLVPNTCNDTPLP